MKTTYRRASGHALGIEVHGLDGSQPSKIGHGLRCLQTRGSSFGAHPRLSRPCRPGSSRAARRSWTGGNGPQGLPARTGQLVDGEFTAVQVGEKITYRPRHLGQRLVIRYDITSTGGSLRR